MAVTMIYLPDSKNFLRAVDTGHWTGSMRQWHAESLAQEILSGITAAKQYGDYLRKWSAILTVLLVVQVLC